MQLSIELLPAPFGPMMARTSCSRTSKLMSVSAFTPPKRRLMFCTSRTTSPIWRWVFAMSGCLPRRGESLRVFDLQRRADTAGAAVLELHRSLDELLGLAVVHRVDQHLVLVVDEAALDLAGARHLAVVRVELLVQDQETVDLTASQHLVGRQV